MMKILFSTVLQNAFIPMQLLWKQSHKTPMSYCTLILVLCVVFLARIDKIITGKTPQPMMPVEIVKPCAAWGGPSVLHIMLGVCHTVPSPEHSQQDRSGEGKRNGGVHMDMVGMSPPPEIGVRWDGRRPGGHCCTNYRCLAAEVCVAAVSWPATLVQGYPTR